METVNNAGSRETINFVRLTENEFNAKVRQSREILLVKVVLTQKQETLYFEIPKKYDLNGNVAADIEKDMAVILNGFEEYQSCKKRFVIYLT